MSCYHPLIGIWTGEKTKSGKNKLKILKDADSGVLKEKNGAVLIPCGHCIGCRLDYSRKWADRMLLEYETNKKAIFVTLTYDNEHAHWTTFDDNDLPLFATLNKRDCQLFMKRLRKEFEGVKIRFFLSGEYGPKTGRPHYHAIIYGISLDDIDDLRWIGRNDMEQQYFTSALFQKIWSNGNILLADVSWSTMAYVSRYVAKKLKENDSYAIRNVIPEFSLMSRKPGIGADYLMKNPDCLDSVIINISTPEGGRKISIPKYYLDKAELTFTEKVDKIREQRKRYSSDKQYLKLLHSGLTYEGMLESEEVNKKEKVRALKRSDV